MVSRNFINFEQLIVDEFYSISAKSWMSCLSSWNHMCAYRTSWYTWPPGEYFDLDNMNWVNEWDLTSQFPINDTQLGNFPLCRSFIYYVDPTSESITELGTYEHPYKELNFVFIELLNFHSHSERNITVRILEGTTTYLHKKSYIINTTEVVIEPYFKTISSGFNPKIIAVESIGAIIPPGVPTRFNILSKNYSFDFFRKHWS